MRISDVETFILHVPVTRNGITDSTHAVTHWGLVGCVIRTDDGVVIGFNTIESRHDRWNSINK